MLMNQKTMIMEVDKYLDDACMAHLEKVRIVHGKGTGVLRNAVRQKLRSAPPSGTPCTMCALRHSQH